MSRIGAFWNPPELEYPFEDEAHLCAMIASDGALQASEAAFDPMLRYVLSGKVPKHLPPPPPEEVWPLFESRKNPPPPQLSLAESLEAIFGRFEDVLLVPFEPHKAVYWDGRFVYTELEFEELLMEMGAKRPPISN